MRLYWSVASIPELADLPRHERMALWRQCFRAINGHWQVCVALVICGYCAVVGSEVGQAVDPGWVGKLVGTALGGCLGGMVFFQVAAAVIRPYLRAERTRQGDRAVRLGVTTQRAEPRAAPDGREDC